MNFTKLSSFMDRLTDWRIPGNSCVVFKDRKPVFRYSSGYSDVEAGKKMQGDEIMFVFSATKVVVCTAALQLWEQGKFILSDPVEKYLPEWADVKVRHRLPDGSEEIRVAQRKACVRDLFTMSAGLDYNGESESVLAARRKYAPKCPTREIVRAMAGEPLFFEPGTRWNYSLCHDVLGALIEVVAGESLADYVQKNIFDVVGMEDTAFGMSDERRRRMAVLYNFDDNEDRYKRVPSQNNDFIFGTEYHSGGAGITSTVYDMAKFADVMCARGVTAEGARILSSRTVDLMRTNCLNPEQLRDFNWDALVGYGYGLGVRTLINPAEAGSPSPVGEFGWTGAAGAYMLIDPENTLAMYYAHHMTNNQESFTAPRLRNILYSCLD